MTRPTDEQLVAWRALADAATKGPWEHEADEISPPATVLSGFVNVVGGPSLFRPGVNNPNVYADAAFIAAAREAVPALLDEVARLREVVAALPRCEYGGCGARATNTVVYKGGRFDSDTGEHEDEDALVCDEHVFDARPLAFPYAAALRKLEGR